MSCAAGRETGRCWFCFRERVGNEDRLPLPTDPKCLSVPDLPWPELCVAGAFSLEDGGKGAGVCSFSLPVGFLPPEADGKILLAMPMREEDDGVVVSVIGGAVEGRLLLDGERMKSRAMRDRVGDSADVDAAGSAASDFAALTEAPMGLFEVPGSFSRWS
jgi:hypothetical protein